MATDPIILAAQARAVIAPLHGLNNVVIRFKTDESEYAEDKLDDRDKAAAGDGGHFRADKNVLTINLDRVITKGKKRPDKLDSIEDFRLHPVLAGVAAHESGHARWTLWDKLPPVIPNPDFDVTKDEGPGNMSEFNVSAQGKLIELATNLEEPRVERLARANFTKTWKKALEFSASHLILDAVDAMDDENENALDSAVRLAVLVGGRQTAGTLGASEDSRKAVKKILDSAQAIIEKSNASLPDESQTSDPFHTIMGLVNGAIFNNDHTDPIPHLEAARQILAIVHPDEKDNPDEKGGGAGSGAEGYAGGADGEDGENPGSGEAGAAMSELEQAMRDALAEMGAAGITDAIKESNEEAKPKANDRSTGHGATHYKNPRAPQIREHVQPTKEDRELFRKAKAWMEQRIEPTVSETESGQWLPVGGARLDVRAYVRDNFAGHRMTQRSDWSKLTETTKPAPPQKVAIMLDGSGSMGSYARISASIAWAAANAAADLPESRTVSVVFGNAAQVTQEPGHMPARDVAISNTDGGMEDFIGAAELVEKALWLDDVVEEGQEANVLIIIVSDLMYGGHGVESYNKHLRQGEEFTRITAEWKERGYQIVVVGAEKQMRDAGYYGVKTDAVEMVKTEDLFKI